jgi:hypothetical protein
MNHFCVFVNEFFVSCYDFLVSLVSEGCKEIFTSRDFLCKNQEERHKLGP